MKIMLGIFLCAELALLIAVAKVKNLQRLNKNILMNDMKTILENTKKFLKKVYIYYRDNANDMYDAWF